MQIICVILCQLKAGCVYRISEQIVSVRNVIPDVHGEAPVIEGNSMHL